MAYTNEIYKEPFWAKSGDFIRGRDPLGIQNSSIATYARLLPGMTNLTLRIRYYGFYLWLLQEYENLPEKDNFKKSPREQYNFIRRAELIIAYLMVIHYNEELNIVGSLFARNHPAVDGYLEIAKSADKYTDTKKGSVYWDYSSGAFGQYYAGALIALNLINSGNDFFFKTDKGNELANAFKRSIHDDTRSNFIAAIKMDGITVEELSGFIEFAIHEIPENSEESKFYISLLKENDGQYFTTREQQVPSQRIQSLILFLTAINENKEATQWSDFPFKLYNAKGFINIMDNTDASVGWYYYHLNELVHFCLESIFWALLKRMEEGEFAFEYFISKAATDVIELFEKENESLNGNTNLAVVVQNLFTDSPLDIAKEINDIQSLIRRNKTSETLHKSFSFLIALFNDNEKYLSVLDNYSINHYLDDKYGNAIEVFQQYVINCMNLSMTDFYRMGIKRVLNNHIAVAFRKMGNGEQNLLKFMVEDNRLIHVETITPRFTSPRLRTLHNMLTDLRFIDPGGKITEKGKQMITQFN